MEAVMDAITAVRARRAEMNVPPSRKAQDPDRHRAPRISMPGDVHFIKRLAYASEVDGSRRSLRQDLKGMVTVATHNATVYLPLAELVDIAAGAGAHRQGERPRQRRIWPASRAEAAQRELRVQGPGGRGQRRAGEG